MIILNQGKDDASMHVVIQRNLLSKDDSMFFMSTILISFHFHVLATTSKEDASMHMPMQRNVVSKDHIIFKLTMWSQSTYVRDTS